MAWLFLSVGWRHRSDDPASVLCVCRLWAQVICICTSSESLAIVLGAEGADMNKVEIVSLSYPPGVDLLGKEGERKVTGNGQAKIK